MDTKYGTIVKLDKSQGLIAAQYGNFKFYLVDCPKAFLGAGVLFQEKQDYHNLADKVQIVDQASPVLQNLLERISAMEDQLNT